MYITRLNQFCLDCNHTFSFMFSDCFLSDLTDQMAAGTKPRPTFEIRAQCFARFSCVEYIYILTKHAYAQCLGAEVIYCSHTNIEIVQYVYTYHTCLKMYQ